MINYLKSEYYRLVRKKSLYVVGAIGFSLIIAAAFVLRYFGNNEIGFPYASSQFFYLNVVSSGILILLIALFYSGSLTGKDLAILKQSISFGISRQTIFWTKLMLTLGYFLVICAVGILLMIGLGESFFEHDPNATSSFLIASVNMLPIIVSGFVVIHVLKILRLGDAYVMFIALFIFTFSGTASRLLFKAVPGLDQLYRYMPSTLLENNMQDFMNYTVQLDIQFWLTGTLVAAIALLIGIGKFTKMDID